MRKQIYSSAAVLLLCLCGCNTVQQTASTKLTHPNGDIEERTVGAKVSTRGDAKAAVEKMSGGATSKSAHIGASGVSEESNATEMIQAIGKAAAEVLDKLITASVAAGAKAVKPVP